MAKRKFAHAKDRRTAFDRIRTIVLQNLNLILSTAEKRVGQRVGDMFLKAAVATALALIPSAITQGISAAVLTDFVTESSDRRRVG